MLAPGESGVAMGVDKSGDNGPAGKIDPPRAFGRQRLYLGIAADRENSVAGNGDGLSPGKARVDGKDVAVQQQEICFDSRHASLVPREFCIFVVCDSTALKEPLATGGK
jgi:hypothetical protein